MALPVTLSDIVFLQPQPPPFKIGTRYYIVAQDASTLTAIKVLRADTDDPTSTWTEKDAAGRPGTTGNILSLHAVVVGTTIHIVTVDASDDVDYHTFRADGTNDDWVITAEEVVADATSATRFLWIGVRSDGDVLVAYNGVTETIMGSPKDRVYIARREATVWTVDVRADGHGKLEADIDLHSAIMADQTNDRFHVIVGIPSGINDLELNTFRSDNSFAASGQDILIDGTVNASVGALASTSDIISFDDGGTTKIRGLYKNNDGDLNGIKFDDADAPTTTITDDINDTGSVQNAVLAIDGTTQHALFQEDTVDLTTIKHDETGAGDDTWGTDSTELDTASTMVVFAANVYDQGGTVLAYIYTEGATEKYNERSLTTGQSLAIGTSLETDSVLPLGLGLGLNLALETDAALALSVVEAKQITLAPETDASLPLGLGLALSLVLEADVARPLGLGLGIFVALETDTALPVAIGGQSVAIVTALETDNALVIGSSILIGVGLETDTALALDKALAITLAVETDTVLIVGKALAIAAALEADSALVLGLGLPIGVGFETDAALALDKVLVIELAAETDTALKVSKVLEILPSLETDVALPVVAETPSILIGTALEVDRALALGLGLSVNTGLEVDTALALPVNISNLIAISFELDTAFTFDKILGIRTAKEVDTALAVGSLLSFSKWTEDLPATGTWAEESGAVGAWIEEGPATGGWAEESPP